MKDTQQVTKRDGRSSSFDFHKIKRSIANASDGLNVNPLELESTLDFHTKEGIETKSIQEILIREALKLSNIKLPSGEVDFNRKDWSKVSARLLLQEMFKKVKTFRDNTKIYEYKDFYSHVKDFVSKGLYPEWLIKEYKKSDFKAMQEEIDPELDNRFDYAGLYTLQKNYLVRDQGKLVELPQEAYATISLILASPEPPEKRMDLAKAIYHEIATGKISLATPMMMNIRRPGRSFASCFIGAVEDSIEDLFYGFDNVSQIAKNGGGYGLYLGKIRSMGSYIQNVPGASKGIPSWAKILDGIIGTVDQLGSRKGALTIATDIWHRDIEMFLELKTETGDMRKKAFDVFPQVCIPDLMMKRVEENGDWLLLDPKETKDVMGFSIEDYFGKEFEKRFIKIEEAHEQGKLKLTKKMRARDLFKHLLQTIFATSTPYIFFRDTINAMNPNKHDGMIYCANLCVESFSNFSPSQTQSKEIKTVDDEVLIVQETKPGKTHVCNLVSINASKFHKDDPYLKDGSVEKTLEQSSKVAVKILDNAIDLTVAPVKEAEIHNDRYRIIGIGIQGLADYLAISGISYRHENSRKFGEAFQEMISYHAMTESVEIAKIKGRYPAFEGSDFSKGILFGRSQSAMKTYKKERANEFSKISANQWTQLAHDIIEHGIRNGSLFATAPNTKTSVINGCMPSFLPAWSKQYVDQSMYGNYTVTPPHLNLETNFSYVENKNLDQLNVIDMASSLQRFTDQGISMDLIVNSKINKISGKWFMELCMEAWKKQVKCIYYWRTISAKEESEEDCISCSG